MGTTGLQAGSMAICRTQLLWHVTGLAALETSHQTHHMMMIIVQLKATGFSLKLKNTLLNL